MWTRPVGLTLTGVPAGLVRTFGQEVRTSGSCEQLRQDGGSVFWGGGASTSANLSGARGPVLRLLGTRPPAQQGAPGVSMPQAWTGPDEGLSSRSWPSRAQPGSQAQRIMVCQENLGQETDTGV